MIANAILSLPASDPLGRCDVTSLSQQTLMEMLLSGIRDDAHKICGDIENPHDLSLWKKTRVNDNNQVMEIHWQLLHITGTIDLQYLPSTVRTLNLWRSGFEGSFDLTGLPPHIHYVNGANNRFSGSIDLTKLPGDLRDLWLNTNKFSGSVCLTQLPISLTNLLLNDNRFSGEVNLTSLPEKLHELRLHNNDFEGETDFTKLPEALSQLTVSSTNLSGDIYVKKGKGIFARHSAVKIHWIE